MIVFLTKSIDAETLTEAAQAALERKIEDALDEGFGAISLPAGWSFQVVETPLTLGGDEDYDDADDADDDLRTTAGLADEESEFSQRNQ